jgi:hypothetical protein
MSSFVLSETSKSLHSMLQVERKVEASLIEQISLQSSAPLIDLGEPSGSTVNSIDEKIPFYSEESLKPLSEETTLPTPIHEPKPLHEAVQPEMVAISSVPTPEATQPEVVMVSPASISEPAWFSQMKDDFEDAYKETKVLLTKNNLPFTDKNILVAMESSQGWYIMLLYLVTIKDFPHFEELLAIVDLKDIKNINTEKDPTYGDTLLHSMAEHPHSLEYIKSLERKCKINNIVLDYNVTNLDGETPIWKIPFEDAQFTNNGARTAEEIKTNTMAGDLLMYFTQKSDVNFKVKGHFLGEKYILSLNELPFQILIAAKNFSVEHRTATMLKLNSLKNEKIKETSLPTPLAESASTRKGLIEMSEITASNMQRKGVLEEYFV